MQLIAEKCHICAVKEAQQDLLTCQRSKVNIQKMLALFRFIWKSVSWTLMVAGVSLPLLLRIL